MATKKYQNHVGKIFSLPQHQVVVEDVLAEGGFALVFLVKSTRNEERYALKRLSVNNDLDLAVCKRELNIVRGLSGHKNIVQYVDSHVSAINSDIHEVLLLMQYCPDNVIAQMTEKQAIGGFTEPEILRIFCDVCEAVAQLHHSQPPVVHRDIKAENVLLSPAGHYVLCDFGSAAGVMAVSGNVQRVQEDLNKYTTLSYRSPEMVDLYSGKAIGTKSDIWALGCLLYRLCFLTLPFGESILAIQRGLTCIPDNSPYSPQLHALIGYLLQVDCDVRPDIYQAAYVAFKLARRQSCPIRNLHNVKVPNIAALTVPPSESEVKQNSTQRSAAKRLVTNASASAVAEVEGTAINPRPRPRAADAATKPTAATAPSPALAQTAQQQQVPQPAAHQQTSSTANLGSSSAKSLPPTANSLINLESGSGTLASGSSHFPPADAFQPPAAKQSQFSQWERLDSTDESQTVPRGSSATSPDSLIDLDSTGLPSTSRLAMLTSPQPNVAMQNCQYGQYGMPFGPRGFVAPVGYYVPGAAQFVRPGMTVPVPFCGATGLAQPCRYPAGFVNQPMTGSHNELHLIQTDAGSTSNNCHQPQQRQLASTASIMKHRRIVSDTSALQNHIAIASLKQTTAAAAASSSSATGFGCDVKQSSSLHSSLQQQQQQQLFDNHPCQSASVNRSNVIPQINEWNPFANDNFGSLTEEAIIAQQLNERDQPIGNGCNLNLINAGHKRSTSDTSQLSVAVSTSLVTPLTSSSNTPSPLARR